MKMFSKAALGALLLAGATALTAAPAAAHVSIGIGFGGYGGYYGPGYYGPPYYAYCDPDSRWFDPYRCDEYDGYDYYNGPVFIDGFWFNGPFRSRFHGGHREFFVHNGWHGGTGFHVDAFSHGGSFHHDGGFHGGWHHH
jgi:hypothetical protein